MTQLSRHPDVKRRSFGSGYVTDAAYKCDNRKCGRYSVVSWYTDYDPSETYRSGEPEEYDRTVQWSPPPLKRPEYPDVPEHVAVAARQAWVCHGHGAYIAACSVARSVIEAVAKDRGITVYGIKAKIKELTDKGLLRGDLIDSADLVREFGNDAAHGDVLNPPSEEEARDVLDIVDEVLHQLYISPARSVRLKASRANR